MHFFATNHNDQIAMAKLQRMVTMDKSSSSEEAPMLNLPYSRLNTNEVENEKNKIAFDYL